MEQKTVFVGIGEYRVARSPDVLRTVLGSCIGVLIYEPYQKIGGMAHIYLPYSKDFQKDREWRIGQYKFDFADLLIPKMIEDMLLFDCQRVHFKAFLIGGGHLYTSRHFEDIGVQNLRAAQQILSNEGIGMRTLDVGGKCGRTVWFKLYDGEIDIQTHEYNLHEQE